MYCLAVHGGGNLSNVCGLETFAVGQASQTVQAIDDVEEWSFAAFIQVISLYECLLVQAVSLTALGEVLDVGPGHEGRCCLGGELDLGLTFCGVHLVDHFAQHNTVSEASVQLFEGLVGDGVVFASCDCVDPDHDSFGGTSGLFPVIVLLQLPLNVSSDARFPCPVTHDGGF